MNIRDRFLIAIIPALLVIFGHMIFFAYDKSNETFTTQLIDQVSNIADNYANDFVVLTESTREVAEGMAISVRVSPLLKDDCIRDLIKSNLEDNRFIYGSTIAFAPGATPLGKYSPYYCRSMVDPDKIDYTSLADDDYDYTNPRWEWFAKPMESGRDFDPTLVESFKKILPDILKIKASFTEKIEQEREKKVFPHDP